MIILGLTPFERASLAISDIQVRPRLDGKQETHLPMAQVPFTALQFCTCVGLLHSTVKQEGRKQYTEQHASKVLQQTPFHDSSLPKAAKCLHTPKDLDALHQLDKLCCKPFASQIASAAKLHPAKT